MWTIKEAYLKYLGVGMNKPLNSFCVYIDDEKSAHIEEDENSVRDISVKTILDNQEYIVSVVCKSDISLEFWDNHKLIKKLKEI